jgi:uncharacterized protein (DUF305 family)/uncharacterized cupredoxin-like copper-binding protein
MRRISLFSIVLAALTAVTVLVAAPATLTIAQTPTADHEQHHPGTPDAGAAATDPCVATPATPAADMPQIGMMTGSPAMGTGDMAGMMGQFDQMFIDMMIPHHASAVAMAQVATSRAEHPEIRSLAEDIIASQSAEIEQMRSWRDQWYQDAAAMPMMDMDQMMAMMGEMMGDVPGSMMGTPSAMPGPGAMGMMMEMEEQISRLCATTEDFDRAFIEAMIPHHQSAIMMAQVALMRAEHPELQVLAQTMIDDQQWEIEQMQTWRSAWSGEATSGMTTPGHAAATPTGSDPTGAEQVAVTLTEFRIELALTTLHAGRPYTFVVTNDGTVTHEFVIERRGATHEPLQDGGHVAMVEGIGPGESRTLEWTFADPGSYQLACHEPGHYEAGQVLGFEVAV